MRAAADRAPRASARREAATRARERAARRARRAMLARSGRCRRGARPRSRRARGAAGRPRTRRSSPRRSRRPRAAARRVRFGSPRTSGAALQAAVAEGAPPSVGAHVDATSPPRSSAASCSRATGSASTSRSRRSSRAQRRAARGRGRDCCSPTRGRGLRPCCCRRADATRDSIRYGFAVGRSACSRRACSAAPRTSGCSTRRLRRAAADPFRDALRALPGGRADRRATWSAASTRRSRASTEFLDEAELPEPVVRFFRLRYDFANLKAALKARGSGCRRRACSSTLGTVPAEAFADELDGAPRSCSAVASSRRLGAAESASAQR